MIKCYCVICGKYLGEYYHSQVQKMCLKGCKGKLVKQNQSGVNNPNYRHGKTIENRCIICDKLIDYRATWCNKHKPNSFKGKTHSKATKPIIGKKSKEKFTQEYYNRVRKTFENEGCGFQKKTCPDI